MRRDPAFRSRVIECENGVGRATRLERPDFLKIFALKKQRRARCLIQARARQHRRPRDVRPDPFMRGANAIEIE